MQPVVTVPTAEALVSERAADGCPSLAVRVDGGRVVTVLDGAASVTPVSWRLLGVGLASGICLSWLLESPAMPFGGPGVGSWGALEIWYDTAAPATIVLALGWSVAVITAAWLAVAAGLQLVATSLPSLHLRRGGRPRQPCRRPAARCRGGATLSVAVGLTIGGAGAAGAEDQPGTASMERLEESPTTTWNPWGGAQRPTTMTTTTTSSTTTTTTTIPSSGVPPGSPTTVPPPAQTSVSATPTPETLAPPGPASPDSTESDPQPVRGTHVVAAGESFWSVAVDVLTALDSAASRRRGSGGLLAATHRCEPGRARRPVEPRSDLPRTGAGAAPGLSCERIQGCLPPICLDRRTSPRRSCTPISGSSATAAGHHTPTARGSPQGLHRDVPVSRHYPRSPQEMIYRAHIRGT